MAVKVTGVAVDTVWLVTLNGMEVAPGGTVTADGTTAAVEDELSAMVAPDPDAGAVSATVQVETPGGVTDTGLQVKPFKPPVCGIVTVAPLPEADKDAAAGSVAPVFGSWITEAVLLVEGDTVRDTVATTPLEIAEEFRPHRTQLDTPGTLLLQETNLPAALADGPAATLADEKSIGE